MATKKVYEVRAINTHTDQREFATIEAYSEKQARFLFKKMRGFHYVGFDTRETCKPGGPMQPSLF